MGVIHKWCRLMNRHLFFNSTVPELMMQQGTFQSSTLRQTALFAIKATKNHRHDAFSAPPRLLDGLPFIFLSLTHCVPLCKISGSPTLPHYYFSSSSWKNMLKCHPNIPSCLTSITKELKTFCCIHHIN